MTKKKKCVEFPPPPPAERLFQGWRGIAAFGFPALPFHKSWIRHCTVLTIRQDMMDQTDENTDKQIKVP